VGPAALLFPFLWLRTFSLQDIVLFGVLTLAYGAALVLLRVVSLSDLAAVARLLRRRIESPSPPA
jgi:hypothetical protein